MIQTDTLNCGTGAVGTWFNGCQITAKDYTKWFLMDPSVKIDLQTDTFGPEDRSALIKSGKLVPINDILQTTEAGAKNNVQTLANKRKIKISQGLYEFSAELEANVCLVKEVHKLIKKKWKLLLYDGENKLFFDNKNGFLNGFSVGFWDADNETVNDGGSKVAQFTVTAQTTQDGTKGYNERRSYLVDDSLIDLNGIENVSILKVSQASAAVKVKLVSGCDKTSPVSGLATKFRVRKASDNTTVTSVVTEVNGEYNIPIASANGDYLIDLYDTTDNTNVVDILDEAFYQSNVLSVTFGS